MTLSIIIVSWNVKEKLRDNLRTLLSSQTNFDFEVIVVDNNSEDGSADMVRQEFPSVELVENEFNFGFAKANNQVLKHLDESRYALLLNPDMKVRPDTLANMKRWTDANPQASVAGCRLVDGTGENIKHVRRFPTVWDQLAIVLKLPHIFPGVLKKYILEDFDYSQPALVDSVRGGFFWINREQVVELNHFLDSTLPLLDERYFIWFEEVDYCRQIKKAGGQVWYTPAAVCTDYVGQSFKQVKRGQTQRYFRDSMLKFFNKWHPGYRYWLLRYSWSCILFISKIIDGLGIKTKNRT